MPLQFKPLPMDWLKENMRYNYETGHLERRKNTGVWKEVYLREHKGYIETIIEKKRYAYHRVVWALANSEDPGHRVIDHIDGDPKNNRPENLRAVSNRVNAQNTKEVREGSRKAGVRWHYNAYDVCIRVGSKLVRLGRFSSLEDASKAYTDASNYLERGGQDTKPSSLSVDHSFRFGGWYTSVSVSKTVVYLGRSESLEEAAIKADEFVRAYKD